MPVETVSFYSPASFSFVDSILSTTDEFFGFPSTNKTGAQFTTSDSLSISQFTVEDGDSTFDDVPGLDQDLTADFTIGGTTYPAGVTADTGYYMEMDSDGDGVADVTVYSLMIDGNFVGFISDTPLTPSTTYTALTGGAIADIAYADMAVCFVRGTRIRTDDGDVAIEHLSFGDLVMTRDNGLQPICWIGSRVLDAKTLAMAENLRPIRIRRDALGVDIPLHDLLVSPQHRVLVQSKIAHRMFGTDEVLVAAKQLCIVEGIDIADDLPEVEYFHMLFDRHEVVISNGAETESLYTGLEALKSVGPAAREEIFSIFPELKQVGHQPETARLLATGRQGRRLAERHAKNLKPLNETASQALHGFG